MLYPGTSDSPDASNSNSNLAYADDDVNASNSNSNLAFADDDVKAEPETL
jgi:hypothetical protein